MSKPLYIAKSDNYYHIQFEYNPEMVDVIKRIPVRRFDGQKQVWVVPTSFSPQTGAKQTAEWYVEAFAKWAVERGFVSGVKRMETLDEKDVPDLPEMPDLMVPHGLLLDPFPYQLQGIAYSIQHKRNILGDQPGLGKSMQAIGGISIPKAYPCLVVCPASLKINWQREWKKFAGKNAIILDDNNRTSWQRYYEMGSCDIFIVNYESLKKFFVDEIKKTIDPKTGKDKALRIDHIKFNPLINLFKSVIIDESHRCRSGKTQQSKICEGISKGKEYVFLLTGTPVVNNNEDLIPQLRIMGRLDDFGGYKAFVNNFCQGTNKSSNLKRLNWTLWNTCFFRREKQKVLKDLPDKMRQVMTAEIDNRKEYQEAEIDFLTYLRKYRNADDEKLARAQAGEVMVRMQILRQISARGKISSVSEFVSDILEQGEKLVLFAYHKEIVHEFKKRFPGAVCVTGEENGTQKQLSVDSFQNDPNVKLIICNYKSAGVGLTLTASSRVGFIEFPWTFADCEQSEDRTHRIGQKDFVNCYYFLGRNTIDEYSWKIILAKKDIADGVTGTDDQVQMDVIDMMADMYLGKDGVYKVASDDVFSGSTERALPEPKREKAMSLFD